MLDYKSPDFRLEVLRQLDLSPVELATFVHLAATVLDGEDLEDWLPEDLQDESPELYRLTSLINRATNRAF